MSYSIGVHHTTEDENGEEQTGYVTLGFEGVSVSGGSKPVMNPPGKAHPGEPPSATFRECYIEDDELDRDLDAVDVFEAHDGTFIERLLEQYGDRHDPAGRNPPGV